MPDVDPIATLADGLNRACPCGGTVYGIQHVGDCRYLAALETVRSWEGALGEMVEHYRHAYCDEGCGGDADYRHACRLLGEPLYSPPEERRHA